MDETILSLLCASLITLSAFYCGMRFERQRLLVEMRDALRKIKTTMASNGQIIRKGDIISIDLESGSIAVDSVDVWRSN
jgi:hypothetical protein